MIAWHTKSGDTEIQINYCEDGLYMEISIPDGSKMNIIVSEDDAVELLQYLQNNG